MSNIDAKFAENITMTRSGSICVSRSNIRDWRIRQIIYFRHNFADPGPMPVPVFIMQRSCREVDPGIMPETGADGMLHRSRAGAEEGLEPNTKPKPDSRGLEGIQGYPHKESADHRPYNPPRKRYSPPLLLFPFPISKFFLD